MSIKETLEKNIVWWSLVMLVAGFASGLGTYKTALQITNQSTLTNGTFITTEELRDKYVAKSDSVPSVDLKAKYVPKELCAARVPMNVTASQATVLKAALEEGKRLLNLPASDLPAAYLQWFEKTLTILRKVGSTEDLRFALTNELPSTGGSECKPQTPEQYRMCLRRAIGMLEGLLQEPTKT